MVPAAGACVPQPAQAARLPHSGPAPDAAALHERPRTQPPAAPAHRPLPAGHSPAAVPPSAVRRQTDGSGSGGSPRWQLPACGSAVPAGHTPPWAALPKPLPRQTGHSAAANHCSAACPAPWCPSDPSVTPVCLLSWFFICACSAWPSADRNSHCRCCPLPPALQQRKQPVLRQKAPALPPRC